MEPTWVLSAPDGPHVGPMNLVIRVYLLQKYRACPLNAHLKYDYEDDLCCHNLPVHFGVLVLMFTPGWFSIILISKKWKKKKKKSHQSFIWVHCWKKMTIFLQFSESALSTEFHIRPCIQATYKTRTTRTPAFWGYPPPPHDYPYHWVILDPKSKEDKIKITNLKNSPKFQNFWIL